MLKPPPTAKPFTMDVDKKLEEGQKVFNLNLFQRGLSENKVGFSFLFLCKRNESQPIFTS